MPDLLGTIHMLLMESLEVHLETDGLSSLIDTTDLLGLAERADHSPYRAVPSLVDTFEESDMNSLHRTDSDSLP